MISSDTIHIPTAGISIMVALRGKQANIVFAFCNPRDSFNRKFANQILKGRLEKGRNVIKVNYLGRTPRKDVLFPIADFVRETLGYHFDSDEKRFLHPETFATPSIVEQGKMDFYEPTTQVTRSVQTLTSQIRNFIDTDLRPTLEAPFQRPATTRLDETEERVAVGSRVTA